MRKNSYKRKKTHFIGLMIVGLILLMSYRNNPPNGHTNAPGDDYCTDCHGSGNPGGFDGIIAIDGLPAEAVPGQAYPLTVTVSNPNGLAERAGFQLVILNSSNQNFGSLTTTDPNATVSTSGGRSYLEHDPALDFPLSNIATWSFTWTAPTVGSPQNFTIYAASNIANGNGQSSGDYIISSSFPGMVVPQPEPLEVSVTGTNITCADAQDGTATANASGGSTPYIYSWNTGASTQTINGLSPGTYTVTVTDDNNETVTGSVTLTQPAALTLSIQASNSTLTCNNSSSVLTATAGGGVTGYSYQWNTGQTTSSITVGTGGVYSVTVSDANDCEISGEILIEEEFDLFVTMSAIPDLCENANPVLLSGFPAGGFFSGNGVNGNFFDPELAGPGTHLITYTYSEGICTESASQEAFVIPLPTISINPVGPLCLDDAAVTLTAIPAGGVFSGPGISGNGVFTPSAAGVGTHTITYTVNGDCLGSGTTQITVNDCACPNPVQVNAGQDFSVCTNEIIQLNGQVLNTNASLWSTSGDGSFDDANILNAIYTPGPEDLTNGSVVLTLMGLDPDGAGPCSGAVDAVTVTFNALPDVTLMVPSSVCHFVGSIELNAEPDNGTWSGPGVDGNVFNFEDLGIGIYTISYSVAFPSGCVVTESVDIEVKDCNTFFEGEMIQTSPVCKYDATGVLEVVPGDDAVEPISYSWSNGATTGTVTGLLPGIYTVTATDAENKVLILSDTLNSVSTLAILEDDTVTCASDAFLCPEISGGIGPLQYAWTSGDTASCDNVNGMFENCLTVTDSLGCVDDLCFTYLPLRITIDSVSPFGPLLTVLVTIHGGSPEYQTTWYHNGESYTDSEDLIDADQPGEYHLVVTDSEGCEVISDTFTLAIISTNQGNWNGLKISPNPFGDRINIKYSEASRISKIVLVNPLNQASEVYWEKSNEDRIELGIPGHMPGTYFLLIFDEKNVYRHRLIKL